MTPLGLLMSSETPGAALGLTAASVRDVVDSVVVLDVSGDAATIAEARAIETRDGGRARVFTMPWPGRRDEAMNELLDLAETEWVLILKPGERFDPAALPRLREFIDQADDYDVVSVLVVDPHAEPVRMRAEPRLIRPRKGLRYVGAREARLEPEALERSTADGKAITITGFGVQTPPPMAPDAFRALIRRDLELIERDVAENPGRLEPQVVKAELQWRSGEPGVGGTIRRLVDRVLSRADQPPQGGEAELMTLYFEDVTGDELGSDRTRRAVEYVGTHLPDFPEPVWAAAYLARNRGEWRVVRALGQMLVDIGRGRRPLNPRATFNTLIIGEAAWRVLAEAAVALRDGALFEAAKRELEAMAPPPDPEAEG